MERIREVIEKIPIMGLLILGVLYFGYDYYSFTTDSDSPLQTKQTQLTAAKSQNQKLEEKVKKAQEFFNSLNAKREEIRTLAGQLDQMKSKLSDSLDIPRFIKTVITEAAKTGVRVVSLKPTESKQHEYYQEQAFELNFRGVYTQLLVFMERLSNLERVIRVDDFDIKQIGPNTARYVDLGGMLRIKTFKYLGSRADQLGGAK